MELSVEVLVAFSWGAAVLKVLQLQERPTRQRHGLSHVPPPVSAPLGPALQLPPFLHIPPGVEIQCFDIHVFHSTWTLTSGQMRGDRHQSQHWRKNRLSRPDQRESVGLLPCNDAEGHVKGYLIISRSDLLLS